MSHKKKTTKPRPTWNGYYPRKTKTKREAIQNAERKYKHNYAKEGK